VAPKYYIQRPAVVGCLQWTGNNLSEIEAFLSYSIHDNGDGTLNVMFPGGNPQVVTTGQWLTNDGQQQQDSNPFDSSSYQVADTAGPHNYTITDV
jgi:hypothetical protein